MFNFCCKSFLLVTASFAIILINFTATKTTNRKIDIQVQDEEFPELPVLYSLHRFTLPSDHAKADWSIESMNNQGELVGIYNDGATLGSKQPFYLDTRTGETAATNLNDFQFDKSFGVPAGWFIQRAYGINNLGDIAGSLARIDGSERTRSCIMEMTPDPLDTSVKPRIHLIPDCMWSQTHARHINDLGVILGQGDSGTAYIYRVPLHGQTGDESVTVIPTSFDSEKQWVLTNPVAGGPTFVKVSLSASEILSYNVDTHTSNLTDISDLKLAGIRDFNDSGSFCGFYDHSKTGNRSVHRGFIFDGEFHALDHCIGFHQTLNNQGDILCETRNHCRPALYHQTHGLILLDHTIVTQNSEEREIWNNSGWHQASALSERNETGFPIIAGTMMKKSSRIFTYGYVLFPIP